MTRGGICGQILDVLVGTTQPGGLWVEEFSVTQEVDSAASICRSSLTRSALTIALSAIIFLIAALAMTYPLVTDLAHSVLETGDTLQVAWLLAWNSEHLFSTPRQLFSAPVMHPIPYALAYIEHMRGLVIPFAPIYFITKNPIFAFNVTLIWGYFLSGFGVFLLLLKILPQKAISLIVSLIAGMLFIFNPWRFWHFLHLEQISASWLGLLVLALLTYLRRGKRSALAFFVFLAILQTLISYYYIPICTILITAAIVWAKLTWRVRAKRIAIALVFLVLVMVIVHLPLAAMYVQNRTHQAVPVEQQHDYSIQTRQDFLSDPQSLWLRQALFRNPIPTPHMERFADAGIIAYILAAVAVVGAIFSRSKEFRLTVLTCLLVAFVGTLLGLGPYLVVNSHIVQLPFSWLRSLPGIGSLRAPARLWQTALFSISILSGLGILALSKINRALATVLGPLLAGLAIPLTLYMPARELHQVPNHQVYGWIAKSLPKDAVLLDAPLEFNPRGAVGISEASKMYAALYHRRRLVNGFLALIPHEQFERYRILATFPSREAMRCLIEMGVTHVLLDRQAMAETMDAEWQRLGLYEIYRNERHQVLALPKLSEKEPPVTFRYGEHWNGLELYQGSRWNLANGNATLWFYSPIKRTMVFSATLHIVTAPDKLSFFVSDNLVWQHQYARNGLIETGPIQIPVNSGWTVLRIANEKGAVHVGDDPRWISYGLGDPMIDGEPAMFTCRCVEAGTDEESVTNVSK